MDSTKKSMNLHWVKFAIPGLGYVTLYGKDYDRGELVQLSGGTHDEPLIRMEYVLPVRKEEMHRHAQCGVCEKWFVDERFRDQHGRLRHQNRFADDLDVAMGMNGPAGGAALRDTTGDAEERRMQQEYPLRLDRTKATLESNR
jgi:hypothetical protein